MKTETCVKLQFHKPSGLIFEWFSREDFLGKYIRQGDSTIEELNWQFDYYLNSPGFEKMEVCIHENKTYQPEEFSTNTQELLTCDDCGANL